MKIAKNAKIAKDLLSDFTQFQGLVKNYRFYGTTQYIKKRHIKKQPVLKQPSFEEDLCNKFLLNVQRGQHWNTSPRVKTLALADQFHYAHLLREQLKDVSTEPVDAYAQVLRRKIKTHGYITIDDLQEMLMEVLWSGDKSVVHSVFKLAAEVTPYLKLDEPALWIQGDRNGRDTMYSTLEMLGEAKATTSTEVKAKYIAHLNKALFPNLSTDAAFCQAVAMLIGYVEPSLGWKIACRVEYAETDPELTRDALPDGFELVSIYEESATLKDHYPGIKATIWKNAEKDWFLVVFTGTTSDGDMDAGWKARAIATGALADADPSGIGKSAIQRAGKLLLSALAQAGCTTKSRVWITGHSLGGALSYRLFLKMRSQNYDNARALLFSSPGIDTKTLDYFAKRFDIESTASDVITVSDPKDWVPSMGEQKPIGINQLFPYRPMGLGYKGIIPSKLDDVLLGHGSPNLVWVMLAGGPLLPGDGKVEVRLEKQNQSTMKNLIEWARPWAANFLFTPSRVEKGDDVDTWLRENQSSNNVNVPMIIGSEPFMKKE